MSAPINDGGPAFPCESYVLRNGKEITMPAQGMTLRDYFAAKALQAIMSAQPDEVWEADEFPKLEEWAPRSAYGIADAMLAARGGSK